MNRIAALGLAALLALTAGSLTSCMNTFYGMGEDLTHFGNRIANSGTVRGAQRDLENLGSGIDRATDPHHGYDDGR